MVTAAILFVTSPLLLPAVPPIASSRDENMQRHRRPRQAFAVGLAADLPIAMGSDCGAQSRMPNGENARDLVRRDDDGLPTERR
jgi:hypothetical protein